MSLTHEWNRMFQSGSEIDFGRAEEILAIWEAEGRDVEDQKELLESCR